MRSAAARWTMQGTPVKSLQQHAGLASFDFARGGGGSQAAMYSMSERLTVEHPQTE